MTEQRVSSKNMLELLVADCPWLLGGSADLSGSNGTRASGHDDFGADRPSGNYLRYGVREHAMAAAMNGIALSGAYTPYGGTFLVFSDYCRPSIRLAALMKLPVVYVFTHDSVGLGEDGPTHQPVEHLASLRLIPGLQVFRPADAVEVAECWELALGANGPVVLALSRQDLRLLRSDTASNRSAGGAYLLSHANAGPAVTFIASGSEVHVVLAAQEILRAEGIEAQVVSAPCLDRLAVQDAETLDALLARRSALCVAVEAGSTLCWHPIVGSSGLVIGIDSFGESASASELFETFGITPEAVAARVRRALEEGKAA